jgi:hypothetical protein
MRTKCRWIATFHRPIHSHWSLPLNVGTVARKSPTHILANLCSGREAERCLLPTHTLKALHCHIFSLLCGSYETKNFPAKYGTRRNRNIVSILQYCSEPVCGRRKPRNSVSQNKKKHAILFRRLKNTQFSFESFRGLDTVTLEITFRRKRKHL